MVSRPADELGRLTAGLRPVGSAVDRWSLYVLEACQSEEDPRTLKAWAKLVATSYTSLRETCYLLGIRPHDARDFTRVLRGILRGPVDRWDPELVLDVSDRRTINALTRRAGLHAHVADPDLLGRFFRHQGFVDRGNPGVLLLVQLLTGDVLSVAE